MPCSMRRIKQQLTQEEALAVLSRCEWGTLAVYGDDGYPYGVPLNYSFDEQNLRIICHCAKTGHKLDAIRANPLCSFTVVDANEVIRERFLTHFRSVICFGHARVTGDPLEMRPLIEQFAARFSDDVEARTKEIEREFAALAMIVIDIDEFTGKEARELMLERQKS